jgi:hypothetical protein
MDEFSLCLDSAVVRRTSRATYAASSLHIKLQVLFLLRIAFHRMSEASFLIRLWRGNLLRTSRAPYDASRRRLKVQEDFLIRNNFHRMSAASVLIQLW